MNKVFVFAGLAAFAAAGAAQAQYLGVNSAAVAPYWYSDYFGSNVNINGNTTGTPFTTGLSSIDIQDSAFPVGAHYANRHQAALAVNGTPVQLQPNADFRFEVDVHIHVANGANAEAGIWLGTAPSFPSSASADIGQMDIIPAQNQIAAFGGTLPFFSNSQSQFAYLPQGAAYDTTYHISMNYYAAGSVIVYGINGVYTTALGIGFNGNPGFAPNSLIGVFEQGPDATLAPGNSASLDVTFSNLTFTVPAPASVGLLGLGGLVAARRRR